MAPIKAAILPLKKNHDGIVDLAHKVRKDLSGTIRSVYDDTGSIGKLYARQDEVGTPFCITVDFDSLEDQTVTVRDRDTWEQERVNVDRRRFVAAGRILYRSPVALAESNGDEAGRPPNDDSEVVRYGTYRMLRSPQAPGDEIA